MTFEFYEKYKYKIKTLDELKVEIGSFPRDKKVIICHGCFDVVHPGHIHHLAYAKSKATVLVVSITSVLLKKEMIGPMFLKIYVL